MMDMIFSAALHDYYADERKALATQAAVQADLHALGIATVYAEYDGVGDGGQIEQISYFDHSDDAQPVSVDEQTNGRVEALLYALLNMRHSGWENNDGAYGNFSWNLIDGTIEHEHSQRYTEHYTSLHEGFEVDSGASP